MANQLMTGAEFEAALRAFLREAERDFLLVLSPMFIENQMNWERPEFDEHG